MFWAIYSGSETRFKLFYFMVLCCCFFFLFFLGGGLRWFCSQVPARHLAERRDLAMGENRLAQGDVLIWLRVKTNGIPFWGRCTTHFRTYFSGDWDVHWGYGILTHGRLGVVSKSGFSKMPCFLLVSLKYQLRRGSSNYFFRWRVACCFRFKTVPKRIPYFLRQLGPLVR